MILSNKIFTSGGREERGKGKGRRAFPSLFILRFTIPSLSLQGLAPSHLKVCLVRILTMQVPFNIALMVTLFHRRKLSNEWTKTAKVKDLLAPEVGEEVHEAENEVIVSRDPMVD